MCPLSWKSWEGRSLENISNHKALSLLRSFVGMLALIKEKLIELNVPFWLEYFDGSLLRLWTGKKPSRVSRTMSEVWYSSISLKAGGVGLNLTAADYVYIVDPWWNPAVEQQADRPYAP